MDRKSETTKFGSPYLFKTVEDLNEVKSTQFWTNHNVRVIGKLYFQRSEYCIDSILVSPVQSRQHVQVNMDFLTYNYPQGRLIEVFGFFNASPENGSDLTAIDIRCVYGVSIPLHYKALKFRKKRAPVFNDKDDEVSFVCDPEEG